MNTERKLEILNKALAWISDHDDDFIQSFINATGLTEEETKELELKD